MALRLMCIAPQCKGVPFCSFNYLKKNSHSLISFHTPANLPCSYCVSISFCFTQIQKSLLSDLSMNNAKEIKIEVRRRIVEKKVKDF